MEDLTGKKFGPYEIVAPLGEGGMASVYKALQPSVGRYVALKVLPRHLAGEATFLARFQQEARLVAQLQHPHILPTFDFGEADGYAYLAMPFMENGTLVSLMNGSPLPLSRVRRIVSQIGDALDYAHAHGVIHRDVKPSNVLMDKRGNCLLTDFGVAKIVEGSAKLTTTGGVIGTPAYMSPEQGLGEKLDGRSDQYALAVIMYELATGKPPYNAETPMAIVIKHINDPLPPPRTLNPELPIAVERVIVKALAKKPEDRYPTVGDMIRAIEAAIPETGAVSAVDTAAITVKTEAPPKSKAPLWAWAVGAVAVIGLVIGAFFALSGVNSNATPTPAIADQPTATAPAQPTDTAAPQATATTAPTSAPRTQAATAAPQVTATTASAAPGIGSTRVAPLDNMAQVYVPGGMFLMGSADTDRNAEPIEKPQHQVTLDAFWIDQTEITNAMYALCVKAGACQPPRSQNSATRLNNDYYGNPQFDHYPVIFVTLEDARAYCRWAGNGTGRLPSEAEWEKAARGPDGQLYLWGNDAPGPSRANYGNTLGDTQAVGQYTSFASPYGALDMAGNVAEWVNDGFKAYGPDPISNPIGSNDVSSWVIRGGSWKSSDTALRAAARVRFIQTSYRGNDVGFRCVR